MIMEPFLLRVVESALYFAYFSLLFLNFLFLRGRIVVCVRACVCVTFAANRVSLSPETVHVMGEGVWRDA